jgi:hypothetical protein
MGFPEHRVDGDVRRRAYIGGGTFLWRVQPDLASDRVRASA